MLLAESTRLLSQFFFFEFSCEKAKQVKMVRLTLPPPPEPKHGERRKRSMDHFPLYRLFVTQTKKNATSTGINHSEIESIPPTSEITC